MGRTTRGKTSQLGHTEPENTATVRCKLFSDNVSEHLCHLRKKELNSKGNFSCKGCPMDAIMQQQLRIVKEVLGIGHDNE